MSKVNGIHHLGISTADMKGQLNFFTQVLGMELIAIFPMHGTNGAHHAFVRLNDHTNLALMWAPDVDERTVMSGSTHAGHAGEVSAPGTMQHLAFTVPTKEDLLQMRNRIRSHGLPVLGTIDHGMTESIYFRGPENLNLEVVAEGPPIDVDEWIDPEVVAACGISQEELAKMRSPEPYEEPDEPVPQPAYDESKPNFNMPNLKEVLSIPDEQLSAMRSYNEPPAPKKKAKADA